MLLMDSLVEWTQLTPPKKKSPHFRISIETSKMKKQKETGKQNQTEYPRPAGQLKSVTYAKWEYQKETKEKKEQKKYLKQ